MKPLQWILGTIALVGVIVSFIYAFSEPIISVYLMLLVITVYVVANSKI